MLSPGSILELKALRGFHHSKLILAMRQKNSRDRKLKAIYLNIERQMLLHKSSLMSCFCPEMPVFKI